MPRSGQYVIVYDITDNRERTRVAKVLAGFGRRVQESVFECRLSTALREKLIRKLEDLGLKTGFILIYRLNDQAKRTALGAVPDDIKGEEEHAFVV